jgi:translation initiation factor IF-2
MDMTIKEQEQDKDSAPVETPQVEEKRIRPSVIRRRSKKAVAAKPEVSEAAPELAVESAVEPKEELAATAVEKEAKEPAAGKTVKKEAAAKPEEKVGKAAAAKKTKIEEVAAEPVKEAAATTPIPPVEESTPTPEAPKVEAAKEEKPAVKKEVKVFGKEPDRKKFYPQKRPARRGRRFRGAEMHRRRGQVVHTRPLKKTEITVPTGASRVVRILDVISVGDLSQRLGVKAGEIIKKLMALGIMATVNQFIDIDSASLIAQEYDYEVENAAVHEDTLIESGAAEGGDAGVREFRPPVVTVMGHVDHGKTSLLDAIKKTNVAEGEAGGITQHIGAYHVHLDKGDVTFLDTPGHEAFTAMRARGAGVTDIVVLVVAADDGVMPQTIEAINHAKAAQVPIIVAINKIDLPGVDPDRVKNELSKYELIPEDWGGDTIFLGVSAKKGTGVKELLEMILLQSEVLELKAAKDITARGVIIEAKLDKGRGPVATVLIQNGTLKLGDAYVTGVSYGRLRAMMSDRGKKIESAGPSMPVEILGLSSVPESGETFVVVKDEVTARQIATMRQNKDIERKLAPVAKISLDDLYERITQGEVKELNLIVKADVHGSIEAVKDSLNKLSTDAVKINFIHSAVGGISEGDIMLAAASSAIVVGFNVRPEPKASADAERENVDIRLYTVIYNLVDDVKNAMEGLLAPIISEEVIGRADVREVFRVSKVGNVAGCYVTDGKAARGAKIRLLRDNIIIFQGELSSLKRFKDDAKEVQSGYECGMTIEGYNDMKAGDVIELYIEKEEMARL